MMSNTHKISGIYCWLNTVNGKRYIGQSVSLAGRRTTHICQLNRGASHCIHLQSAWSKYGASAFEFSVLEEVGLDQLDERERHWIAFYNATDRNFGYNAEGGGNANKKRSSESIAKAAAKMRGRVVPLEMRKQISEKLKGRTIPRDIVEKMSNARRGKKRKPHTPEAIQRMRDGHKGRKWSLQERIDRLTKNNGYYFSKEQREKISANLRTRVVSEETRMKRSMSTKGVPKSEEWKRKISEAHRRNSAKNAQEKYGWAFRLIEQFNGVEKCHKAVA